MSELHWKHPFGKHALSYIVFEQKSGGAEIEYSFNYISYRRAVNFSCGSLSPFFE